MLLGIGSYNPVQLKRQTKESTVYSEEERDLAQGGDWGSGVIHALGLM